MSIPLATTRVRIERVAPDWVDPDEPSPTAFAEGVRAHIGRPSGTGSQEVETHRLNCDPVDLEINDIVIDENTAESYQVLWADSRHGLGLDHCVAGLLIGTRLTLDAVVVSRPGSAVDAEGNPTNVLTVVATTRGTWGSPAQRDLEIATQTGQVVDAVLAITGADIRLGDRVNVRSNNYEVVGILDVRFHSRISLRRVDG